MKVYVVTAGAYSEFHICQVFLDKEKAEMYALANNDAKWYDDHEVHEYETHDEDFNVDPSAKVLWQYKIEFRPGSNGWTSRIWKKFQRLGDVENKVAGSEVTLTLDEDNDEKALRIARERFAKLQYERAMNEPKEEGWSIVFGGEPGSGGRGGK